MARARVYLSVEPELNRQLIRDVIWICGYELEAQRRVEARNILYIHRHTCIYTYICVFGILCGLFQSLLHLNP